MKLRLRPLRSLRNRLALLFFAVTALALAVVVFFFLPQLESQIVDQKLGELRKSAGVSAPRLERVIGSEVTARGVTQLARTISDATSSRVTLLGVQQSSTRATPHFYVITDSNQTSNVAPDWGLATRAVHQRQRQEPPSAVRGATGEVAVPLFYAGRADWVAVFSRDFGDARQAVQLVRDRLLVASAVALLVALLGGWLVARRIALRVHRLETAARALAAGRHVEPLPVDSEDELGRLTRAFNEMQEQLSRVDRARREFIANASHELRTPIFSLGGFVELLQDEQLDQATRDEFLTTMAEQVERLQKLAVDLLDLSRLDAGSIDLNAERVDLADLAGAVTAEFRPFVDGHRTELDVRLPDEPVLALCDRERAMQIMRILLDNALRHTPEGTPVTVIAGRDNGTAELAVADKGPGVAPASHTQVFERFYTADAARGSGLGLAIAKELAERMDGRITLNSRPGRTVFKLTLPVADDDSSDRPE
jgi:two-component system, OmpR family, sensor kinase